MHFAYTRAFTVSRSSRRRVAAVSGAFTMLACHHPPRTPDVLIPAGPFLFTTTEQLCRSVQRPGDSFTAPIFRVDPLTGATDLAIPRGTVGLFQVDSFETSGRFPMVYLRVRELVVEGRHVAVSGASATSNPESVAAAPNEPVCVPVGSRFLGMLTEDVKAK